VGNARIIAVFEPRSNTMKLGAMQDRLAASLDGADLVYCHSKGLGWDPSRALRPLSTRAAIYDDLEPMVDALGYVARPGDHVLVMSNGGFGGIHERLLARFGRGAAEAAE
jgi:UDP-N-acetylmuramate: L-alanyl-gamma-D-glutamyl-meso-diaminopimelate ligase